MNIQQFLEPLGIHEVIACDFEFTPSPRARGPYPICCVWRELFSGRLERIWLQPEAPTLPPYDIGPNSLFVAYAANAEFSCHHALGWELPCHVLDLYVEYRALRSGLYVHGDGYSLLDALLRFELPAMDPERKEGMHALAIRGTPFSDLEKAIFLSCCQEDVEALALLLPEMLKAMLKNLDVKSQRKRLKQALRRGRYMKAVSRIERMGIPIDTDSLHKIEEHWDRIKDSVVHRIDDGRGIYDEHSRFNKARFMEWTKSQGIYWPRLNTGTGIPDLKDETFDEQAKIHPELIGPLHDVRRTLGKLRPMNLQIGSDNRARCGLGVFGSITGRNQQKGSQHIFSQPKWRRSIAKPEPGTGFSLLDFAGQEFGIAAFLSGDRNMQSAYVSGDPYLYFGKLVGAIPVDGTKASHPAERQLFKTVALAQMYGQTAYGISQKLGVPVGRGHELVAMHKAAFPQYWRWSDAVVMYATAHRELRTTFGWPVHFRKGEELNPRSIRNFPMQANAGDILREVCCLTTEAGLCVIATIHDAILLESTLENLERDTEMAQALMAQASETVVPGFRLRTDITYIRYPDRFRDERGIQMWETVITQIAGIEAREEGAEMDPVLIGRYQN